MLTQLFQFHKFTLIWFIFIFIREMLIVNTIKDITSIIIIFYKILILLSIFFINFIVNIFVCLQIMKCFSTSNLMTLSATSCTLCSFLVFPSLASLSSFKRLALSDLELIFYRFYFNTNMKERLKSFFFLRDARVMN